MDLITKLRYQGYAKTPPLWTNTIVSQFKQIDLNVEPQNFDDSVVFKNQRLGKLVEEFVFNPINKTLTPQDSRKIFSPEYLIDLLRCFFKNKLFIKPDAFRF